MAERAEHHAKLVELLAGIDFGKRYYAFYEQARQVGRMPGLTREDVQAVISGARLTFKYNKREDFFDHNERHDRLEVGLNVAVAYSTVELIFKLKTEVGHVGGPFPLLARQVERLSDPNFSYTPGSPKLPFSNLDELQAAVDFGVGLYEDARRTVLAYNGWES
jgi:hypothetical protein